MLKSEPAATKRKKILFGITKANWGGAQRYIFDLATRIPRGEFDVSVMAGSPGSLKTRLEEAKIPFRIIPALGRDISLVKEIATFWSLWRAVRAERPDILHLNSPKMAGLGTLAGRMLGVPKIVTTVHGMSTSEKRGLIAKALIAFFSWLTALLSHQTILINTADFKTAKNMPLLRESRFSLIYIGIDPKIAVLDKESARKYLREHIAGLYRNTADILKAEVWVGTISELVPNKNLPLLISAAAMLPPEIPVVIIGDGDNRKALEKLIREYGGENRIFLAGFISDAARLLSAFDIFTLTSTKEGLPYALLESGLAGKAVIATDIKGNTDVIIDGKTGVLTPLDRPDILCDKIITLSRDPKRRDELGQELKKRMLQKFGIQAMVDETLSIYRGERPQSESEKPEA